MRISYWSSDVCSSDLRHIPSIHRSDKLPPPPLPMDTRPLPPHHAPPREEAPPCRCPTNRPWRPPASCRTTAAETGRAPCRERVCQYVYISVVAVSVRKTTEQSSNTADTAENSI